MYQAFDFFGRHDIPQVWLCNPSQQKIANLKAAFNINPTIRFNEMSEITLTYPDEIEIDGKYVRLDAYDLIESKRLIYVENLGYFLINGVTENSDGIKYTKTVTAYSLESELNFKKINMISGTYKFWDVVDPKSSLLGNVFSNMPGWGIEHVDVELWDLWRTFEIPDTTVYDFLMNTVEQAYQCVFTFNTEERKISAWTFENATSTSNIYMSFDTLLQTINVEEKSDEIVTALKVYGDAELDISSVNPLGSPTIYNFDYYKNTGWMSQSLIDAINAWEAKIEQYNEPYKSALADIKTANERLYVKGGTSAAEDYETTIGNGSATTFTITHNLGTTCPGVLVRDLSTDGEVEPAEYEITYSASTPNSFLITFNTAPPVYSIEITVRNIGYYTIQGQVQERYDSLMQVKAARIDANMEFADINEKLELTNNQLIVINQAIQEQENILTDRRATVQQINKELQFSNSFTQEQLIELDPFIIENTYQNSSFISTDSMTIVETQDMQEQLLAQGEAVLQRVSVPRYTFSVDSANFLYLKEFQQFAHELDLGTIIYVRINDNLVATPILLELQYSLDNPNTFTMTFGNRYRLDDDAYVFSDLFQDAISAGTSSSFNQELWNKFVSSGADTALNSLLTEAWDAAKNEIINAANQQIVIDGAGLRGRMQNTDGSYDDRQVWLTGKTLAFTDDNWDSVKLALGEITFNNTKYYGLAAEAVVGQLIAGSNLFISNTDNSFIVDGDGVRITSGSFELTNNDQLGRMIYNPEDGFKLQARPTPQDDWEDVLAVNDGTLVMNGDGVFSGELSAATGSFSGKVTAGSGSIGGWQINNPILQSNDGKVILNPNGLIDLNNFHIRNNGVFYGSASNPEWSILNNNIGGNEIVLQANKGLLVQTKSKSLRFQSDGYSMTFNGQPIAVGAVPSGVDGTNSILELRSGYVSLNPSAEFYNIAFSPSFRVAPMIVGTAIYKGGMGTDISNSFSGGVSVKFSNINTNGCIATIGARSGVDWTDITDYFQSIHWIAIGFKAAVE